MSVPSPDPQVCLPVSPTAWIQEKQISLDGRPIDLTHHLYQVEPLEEMDARRQCAMKGAQLGWTSISMIRTLHGQVHGYYPQGVLYLFPSREDTTDFSKARFTPLINDNPQIAGLIKDTDAANIKRVGKSILYMRGARATRNIQGSKKSSTQLKSIPVDRIVFDEYDEMEPAMVDLALERLAHSAVKEEYYLSTPTIPDFGVDKLWQQSDQRCWYIKCQACGAWTCLEEEFPLCLEERADGTVYRACKKCRREISPLHGGWYARYPSRAGDLVGWWISQLNSLYVSPKSILDAYRTPPNGRLQEVYNSKLARAYIEAVNRLSIAQVLALCGSDGIAADDPGPCSMGVDQGKDFHVVIGRKHPSKAGQIVHLGVYKGWEDLDALMRNFHVYHCIVDALPETHKARAFARRFPGKVFLSYYVEKQKGGYNWNEGELQVNSNRTESLDASHVQVMNADLVLPRQCEAVEEFAKHLHNTAKRLEEDEETGSKRYVYVKLGPDHFRHAFNYEAMARTTFANALFPEFFA